MTRGALLRLVPLVLLCSCGDNRHTTQDASSPGDASDSIADAVDASPDAAVPLSCAYAEMADPINDDLSVGGMPEETLLTFSGPLMICGTLDNTHYDSNTHRIDIDSYIVSVTAASGALLTLTAPGAEAYDSVFIDISGMTVGPSVFGELTGDHAATSAFLPPDDYLVSVQALHDDVAPAALDYKLTLLPDPASRCATSSAPPSYQESNDGPGADGNDVIEVHYHSGDPRRLTLLDTDAPEPTGLTIEPNTRYRLRGENAMPAVTPASWSDSYRDRDTYLVTTGATTNQLAVRINWPGNTSDFDLFVFTTTSLQELARCWNAGTTEDEFTTFAVEPNTQYRIWAGTFDTSMGLPINYDLTICGESFTQP